jgi:4-hydroxy-2-oxoheptanedioate aldolase
MDLPVNQLKQNLANKTAQIGLWLSLASGYTAEIVAQAGYHWFLIDGEHAPNTIPTILAQLQALAPYRVHPVARVPVGDTVLIKQYLDLGLTTLLVPMVESAAQARQLVAAMRYPPDGVRGVGATGARASRFSSIDNYAQRANQEMCLLVQVETVKGLDNLDQIAAVDGVDGVFFGPADLSASMGLTGQLEHPDVQHAIERAIKQVLAAGKAPGILSTKPPAARHWLTCGCLFVAVGLDAILLVNAARQLRSEFPDA